MGKTGHESRVAAQLASKHFTGVFNGHVIPRGHCVSDAAHAWPAPERGQETRPWAVQEYETILEQSVRHVPSTQREEPTGQVT